ncbi:MAG: hypothetical protein LBT05_09495 [Planctomycetaceae bacterium]|jgi:hypothetical protein|nr:hypothetical protein [Planctomycetaceae bacterium]
MISIFFLLVNFLAMGFGVWIAIRQKEQSLRVAKILDVKTDNPTTTAETISLTPESQKIETRRPRLQENSESFKEEAERSIVESIGKAADQNEYDIVSELETSLFSTAMIENIVEMIQESKASEEFLEIASQLQEIHDLMVTPDKKYYVSEDAKFFITPKESPFVSAMFCRPIVGGKK